MEALYGAVTVTGLRRLLIAGSITVDEVADGLTRMFSVGGGPRPPSRRPRLTFVALLVAPLPPCPMGASHSTEDRAAAGTGPP